MRSISWIRSSVSWGASALNGLTQDHFAEADHAAIVAEALRNGQHRNPTRRVGAFTTAYFYRPDELRAELTRAGLEVAAVYAVEGPVGVLHGDLQHFNVLKAERTPWLAIDPKGVVGPPEDEAAALLRNPRRVVLSRADPVRLLADRVAVLAECLGDDPRLVP